MNEQSPYKHLEKSPLYKALDKAIGELVENGDVVETTPRRYIVGYLTKAVTERPLRSPRLRKVRNLMRELAPALSELEKESVEGERR